MNTTEPVASMATSRPRTRQVSLAAIFAAAYFVLRSTPTFQMIGTSGRFTTGDFLLTSIALIGGLWSGVLSVLAGTIIAYAVNPPIFFGLDFLPAIINVLVVTLILSNRIRLAKITYLAVYTAFVVSPYSLLFGYGYVPYTWLHIAGLVIVMSPFAGKIPVWIERSDSHQITAVAGLAFLGTMAQHLAGGLLYEVSAGYVGGISPSHFKQVWTVIFWLYPTERLVIAAVSAAIAVPLFRSVKKWAVI